MPPTTADFEQPSEAKIARAIAQLLALRDADRAVIELIALGPRVIPPLREFLLQHRPSGIYQPARDAVFVLASLHADDALMEYLAQAVETDIADPADRTGEDAIVNAAARALRHRRDDACFALLMTFAGQRPLGGVIEALGEMGREAAIPRLIEGLASDFTRHVASAALTKFGARARPALLETALTPKPSAESESATSHATRQSAVGVLSEIGVTLQEWSRLRPLAEASDTRLAALTWRLALVTAQPLLDRETAIRGLIRLLKSSDWLLTMQIEGWLAQHHELAIRIISQAVDRGDSTVNDETVRRSLLRVIASVATTELSASPSADLAQPPSRPRGKEAPDGTHVMGQRDATNCPSKGKNVNNTHAFPGPRLLKGLAILSHAAPRTH